MYIDSSRLTVEIVSPDVFQQTVSCHDNVRVLHKALQKFILFERQCHNFSICSYFMFFRIHLNVTKNNDVLWILCIFQCSSKDCFDPGYKLHHSKWFGHVIVCPSIQCFYFIVFCTFCCQHNDRNITVLR